MFFRTFFLILIAINVFANGKTIFDDASIRYGIDKALLVSVAKHESGFEPFVVGIALKNKQQKAFIESCIEVIGCKAKVSSNRAVVYPNSKKEIQLLILALEKTSIDYDVGLMQINQWNIKKRGLIIEELFYNTEYNVEIGAKILSECTLMFPKSLHNSLECYNKGTDSSKFNRSYSSRVLDEYIRLFKVK